MGPGSPRPYSQTAYHGQQRSHFHSDPSFRPGRRSVDNVAVNHAPTSFNRHKPDTPGNDLDLFAADFQNSTNPNQPSVAYDQRGRDPHLMYSFSSSSRTFNTHGTNHTGTTINYSGSQEEDDQRSRPPLRNSSTQRARSSSSDSFVYDVGFKSVQDAQRRAARRKRDHDSRDPSGLSLENRFGRASVNFQSRETLRHPSSRRIVPATKWRKQVCYGCTPGYCICPTVSDDSE